MRDPKTSPAQKPTEYDVFISYRRSDGTSAARWLRRALLGYRPPRALRPQRKAPRVFLDVVYERATDDFYEKEILPALRNSRYLIVIATPQTLVPHADGGPNWVEREIQDFLATPQRECVFVALAAGTTEGRLVCDLDRTFPRIERLQLGNVSRWPLLRWSERRRLHAELLKLAAPLWEIPQEDMPLLHREESRRRQLWLSVVTGVTLILLALVTGLFLWAVRGLNETRRELVQNHLTQGRYLAVSRPVVARLHFAQAVVVAEGSSFLTRGLGREAAIGRAWLGGAFRQPPPVLLWHPGEVLSAFFNSTGDRVVTASRDGAARIWDSAKGVLLQQTAQQSDLAWSVLGGKGSILFSASQGSNRATIRRWESRSGHSLAALPFDFTEVVDPEFSPRPDLLLGFDSKHRFRAWDAAQDRAVGVPIGLSQGDDWFSLSPRGDRLVALTSTGTLRLWNLLSGRPLGNPKPYAGLPTSIAWSADGHRFVNPIEERRLMVWSAEIGEPLSSDGIVLPGLVGYVRLSRDGSQVLAVWGTEPESSGMALFDAVTGSLLAGPVRPGTLMIGPLASPDERRLVTVTAKSARLWDGRTLEPIGPEMGQDDPLQNAILSPDGNLLATIGLAGDVRVWRLPGGAPVGPVLEHQGRIVNAQFDQAGARLLTASLDGTVRIWPLDKHQDLKIDLYASSGDSNDAILAGAFDPQGLMVVTGSRSGIVRLWNAVTGALIRQLPQIKDKPVTSIAFSPTGDLLVTASSDGQARLWTRTGQLTATWRHQGPVRVAAFSPDGNLAVTGGDDKRAKLWSVSTHRLLCENTLHQGSIVDASFSPDKELVATAGEDGTVRVWSARNCASITVPLRGMYKVFTVAFSPDGKSLASANASTAGGGDAQVWQARTGVRLAGPFRNRNGVRSVAFSPDGRFLATSGMDGTAQVWDIERGVPVGKAKVHPGIVWTALFSQDGGRLLTAGFDRTIRVWDPQTGDPIGLPLEAGGEVMVAVISPDGRRLLSGTARGQAAIWAVPIAEESADRLLLTAEVASGLTLDKGTGTVRMLSSTEWETRKRELN